MINKKNNTGSFIRAAIAGALDFFNRNVSIVQTVDNVDTDYAIKFYYHFGQDEQFMKDFFVERDKGCLLHEHPEGNFEMRPLGVVKFNGFSLRTSDMTNKYVRGTYTADSYDGNNMRVRSAFSAYLMRLPMTIKMSVDLHADNLGQAMVMMEALLTGIYKSNVVYFQYGGLRVPAELLMADDIALEKKVDFTYADNQTAHAKFDVEMNTTFPIFDAQTSTYRKNIIREFRLNFEDELHTITEDSWLEKMSREESADLSMLDLYDAMRQDAESE